MPNRRVDLHAIDATLLDGVAVRVDFCTAQGTALAAPRGLERLHVGDDAGDGRLLRGVRHPGCPGAGYALPVSRGPSAPAKQSARETNPTIPRITPASCLEAPTLSTCICSIAEAWF